MKNWGKMKREDHIYEQRGRERVKVLLIEDNPGDMRLIRELLSDFQQSDRDNPLFDIAWADNLNKGLEQLASENIDALLLDLSLPDSHGFATFLKVIDRAPNIPIIILTGLDDETMAVKALQDGAQDYLLKGQVDSGTLGRAILYAMERNRLQAREEKKPVSILLVEDNDGDAKLISISLTEFPSFIFELTHVKSLKEAFNVLDKRTFDIILLDLILPGSHGIETFMRIHERAKEIPVIVITVLGDERHAIQSLRKGAQDYLVKGQIIDDLLVRRIQYAVERHRLERDRQIRNAEEVYRTLTMNSQSGVHIIQDGKMQFMNPYIMKHFGFSAEELTSMDILNIVHPEDREIVRINAIRMLRGESSTPYEYRIIDKGGQIRWLIESVSSIPFRGKRAVLGNVMDITEGKQLDEALRESEEQYRTLVDNIDFGINLIDKDFKIIATNVVSGRQFNKPAGELVGKNCFKEFEKRQTVCQHCPAVQAMATGQPHQVDTEGIRDDNSRFSARIHAFPLFHPDGATKGFVEVVEDVTDRKQAEEKLKLTLESLRKAVGATIQVMVSAVETRDPYTAGHQRRSADLARAIAIEMGFPQEKIDGISMAGSIHDIGKLSIPAEILSKPRLLTEIEFSLIKEHPRIGYEILKNVESPWPLAEIVYQHHERMDGSGYPRNLKGDDIIMEARIMAVADVVEAMASHRPYRPGLGIYTALEEIEKNKGTLYDNTVAEACLRLFREKSFQL
jgi:PAS domain S-box-containing protein